MSAMRRPVQLGKYRHDMNIPKKLLHRWSYCIVKNDFMRILCSPDALLHFSHPLSHCMRLYVDSNLTKTTGVPLTVALRVTLNE